MLYSFIIPVYNAEPYLSAALDSVLQQDASSHYEIVLIDDGSTDRSGAICGEYAAKDARVRVIRQENAGASAARNTGIRAARGQYILFLDSDDFFSPGLFPVLDSLTKPRPDMITFASRHFFDRVENGIELRQALSPSGESGTKWLNSLFQIPAVPLSFGCLYGIQRTFLKKHQILFRPELRVSEDFDFIMRCLQAAESITGTDQILYNYRFVSTGLSKAPNPEKYLDALTVKAQYFRQYPTAAMANYYCGTTIALARLGNRKVLQNVVQFVKENRDIWDYVTDQYTKLGLFFFRFLGCYNGSAVFCALQDFKHRITKRRK